MVGYISKAVARKQDTDEFLLYDLSVTDSQTEKLDLENLSSYSSEKGAHEPHDQENSENLSANLLDEEKSIQRVESFSRSASSS